MTKRILSYLRLGSVLTGLTITVGSAFGVPSTISIQGTLESAEGGPVSGEFLYRVRFFDGQIDGNLLGEIPGTTTVSEGGRFSISLELPPPALSATTVWYDLSIDSGEDGIDDGDIFPERVRVHSVPFALHAGDADSLGGLVAQDYLSSASLSTAVWSLDGNAISGVEFLGTRNNQPLELRANNQAVFRVIPDATSPNILGGHSSNLIENGVSGGTISGGGWTGLDRNRISADFGTVGGGSRNVVSGGYGVIAGGSANIVGATYAAVAGGEHNAAWGTHSAVGGGNQNQALSRYSTVGGGYLNHTAHDYSTIAGGWNNQTLDPLTSVGGGFENSARGGAATIAGGWHNTTHGLYAMVAGGMRNSATGDFSFAAGHRANALHQGSFVWADSADEDVSSTTDDQFLVRASGGINLTINGDQAGLRIVKSGDGLANIIGGAGTNEVTNGAFAATVAGGQRNVVSGFNGTVGGGRDNEAVGASSTVPGGIDNLAEGNYSFAAGVGAEARHDGSFVWSDESSLFNFASKVENEFAVRAENGLRLSEDAPQGKDVGFGEYYRDNSILAWAKVTANGTINASRGVESVTHPGNGVYRLTLTDGAANANTVIPVANAEIDDTPPEAAADLRIVSINQRNAPPFNTFDVYINRGTGALVDNDFVFMLTGR